MALAAAACGDGEPAPGTGMFQPLADSTAPTLDVREAVSAGGREAAGSLAFERVSSLAVGPDGRVWILDGPAGRIVVLDEQGREVRSFGGRGDGPGEFTVAGSMGFLGDSVWVMDAFTRRTAFFSLEGEVLGTTLDTVPVDPVRFRNPARPSAYLEGGSLVAVPAPRSAAAGPTRGRAPVLRVDRTTGMRDTLTLRPAWTSSIPVPSGSFAFNPLTDHPLVAVDPRGRWVVVAERPGDPPPDGHPLVVRVRRLVGDSIAFDVRYAVEGVRVGSATRDSVVEAGVERLRTNMELVSELRETIDDPRAVIEEAIRLPTYHPPVTALVAASDGTTWLARHGRSHGFRTWTVLGPGGSVRRHVRIPGNVEVRDADGDRVWGVARDSLDVQRVVGLEPVAPGVAGAGPGARSAGPGVVASSGPPVTAGPVRVTGAVAGVRRERRAGPAAAAAGAG